MKRLLASLLMLGSLAAAEKHVIATRLDQSLVVPTSTLPWATWTNVTSWAVGATTGDTSLLDFSSAQSDLPIVDVPCLAFDGVDGYFDTGIKLSNENWTVECFCFIPAYSERVYFTQNGASGFFMRQGPASWQLYANGGYAINETSANLNSKWVALKLDYVASTTTFTMSHKVLGEANWTVIGSGSNGEPAWGTATLIFGQRSSLYWFDGKLAGLSTPVSTYNFEETSGTVAYDSSGNGNDGTHSGGVTHTNASGIPCANAVEGFGTGGVKASGNLIVNGDFDSGTTNWTASVATLTVVAGELKVVTTGSARGVISDVFTTVAGRRYSVTADLISTTSDAMIRARDHLGNTIQATAVYTNSESIAFIFTADTVGSDLYLRTPTAGTVLWDNVEAYEITEDDVRVPADASDPTKDVLGNTLTNPGGLAHNNGGYGITQDPAGTTLLDQVTVTIDGTPYVLPYVGDAQSHPAYYNNGGSPTLYIGWETDHWYFVEGSEADHDHPTATGLYPPKTGWPNYGTNTFSVSYTSGWLDDGVILTNSFANLLTNSVTVVTNSAGLIAEFYE